MNRLMIGALALYYYAAPTTTDAFIVREGKASTSATTTPPSLLHPLHPTANNLKASSLLSTEEIDYYGQQKQQQQQQLTAPFAPLNVAVSPLQKRTILPSLQQQQQEGILSTVFKKDFIGPVISACFLITSNTVGAGCLVMPELAAGPGLATTMAIFGAAYLINLASGLLLADVAISQNEQQAAAAAAGKEDAAVPASATSLKELAQTCLQSDTAAMAISAISVATNACVHAFGLSRVGITGSALLAGAVAPPTISIAWAAAFGFLLSTQSRPTLSAGAAVLCTALFASFAALLLPGLAAVSDPVSVLTAAGTAADIHSAAAAAAPVILMSMVYQNIVPATVQMLDYDRTKTVTAIVAGSMIPLLMYGSWSFACLGGGIIVDTTTTTAAAAGGSSSSGAGGLLMTIFSLATLAGSTLGTGLSMAGELQTFFLGDNKKTAAAAADTAVTTTATTSSSPDDNNKNGFGLPTAAVAVGLPLVAALTFGGDGFTDALAVAGSFGTPLLYGALPVAMAYRQRQQQAAAAVDNDAQQQQTSTSTSTTTTTVPPPTTTIMTTTKRRSWAAASSSSSLKPLLLGVCSMGFAVLGAPPAVVEQVVGEQASSIVAF